MALCSAAFLVFRGKPFLCYPRTSSSVCWLGFARLGRDQKLLAAEKAWPASRALFCSAPSSAKRACVAVPS